MNDLTVTLLDEQELAVRRRVEPALQPRPDRLGQRAFGQRLRSPGRVRLQVSPPDATIRLNGNKIEAGARELWMKAGGNMVRAEAAGFQPQVVELDIQGGDDIAIAIGVDPGSSKLDALRYRRICILADADSDGLHIATLLCALFLRHFRPLVAGGRVFVAMPPLYRIDSGKNVYYALDDAERQGVLDRIKAEGQKGKVTVTRFKGLGEMNPLQLRETTMAPDTRRLVQLTIDAGDDVDQLMDMLLAKKRAGDRKAWLESKGNLAEI